MNASPNLPVYARPARAPVFFWITVALLGLLFLGGAVGALLLVFEAKGINRSGGWGWLLVGAIYVVAIVVVCFACALSSAVSLFRRESHRRLSIVILIISGLVVAAFGPTLIRAVHNLRHQRDETARTSEHSPRPSADAAPRLSMAPSADNSRNTAPTRESERQQISELKSKLWQAIRSKDADTLVDCFFVEERFNTPATREENRKQVEILLKGETIDVEVRDIPTKEVIEIVKIQNAKPASLVRYSLLPRLMLRIQQETSNGQVGRSFLIGEKNGKWYIVTLAGHTT
jgi:hypothetical protein